MSDKCADVGVAARAGRTAVSAVPFGWSGEDAVMGVRAMTGAAWALWTGGLIGAVEGHPLLL
jgi:hypothetical protein